MQRQKVILGNHIYLIDRFPAKSELSTQNSKFIMLRKYEFEDNLTFDKDVYIISKENWDKYKNGEFTLAFPNTYSYSKYSKVVNFSSKISDFNETFNYNESDLFEIFDENRELANIDCDVIRIYHPHTKINNNFIIYINSYINNVRFHLYCSPISQLKTQSETEICVDNIYYSEYVEFLIPNIRSLFNDGLYYDDSINLVIGKDSSKLDMKMFKTLFTIEEITEGGIKNFAKKYIEDFKKINMDSSNHSSSINILLYPYDGIEENSNHYLYSEKIRQASCTFIEGTQFTLSAKFVLDGYPQLRTNFIWPKNPHFDEVKDAYEFFNNISLTEYKDFIYEDDEDSDEYEAEKYGDVDGEVMKLCGYRIEIATDRAFRNIIYDVTNWDYDVDDFNFDLSGIFTEWEQYPEILIARTTFIDRYLGNDLYSNHVIIDKEQFKYMLADKNREMIFCKFQK